MGQPRRNAASLLWSVPSSVASGERASAAAGLLPTHAPGFDALFGKGLDIDAMFDQAVQLAKQPIFADEGRRTGEGDQSG